MPGGRFALTLGLILCSKLKCVTVLEQKAHFSGEVTARIG